MSWLQRMPQLSWDGVLSPTQANIWQLMVQERNEKRRTDETIGARYQAAEAEIDEAVEAGRLTRKEANQKLGEIRRKLWPDSGKYTPM